MKKILVCGGGGFIGGAMAKRLKEEGHWVRVVDLKLHEFVDMKSIVDDFDVGDLRCPQFVEEVITPDIDEVYQFAADMGGAGFCFTGDNDSDIMHNSALINLNVVNECIKKNVKRIFYSSSACMYPEHNQLDPDNPNCTEDSAYPAEPDSEYGWEKLFSERLYFAYARNHGLEVRVARYHNIFGPEGTWDGGREKAPAAICRKVARADEGAAIEVWGDGLQTRSFLYIDECIEATRRFMDSDFQGPVNIGSEEMISMNDFTSMVIGLSEKDLSIENIPGPVGVRGRNSDNTLYEEKIGWVVSQPLETGLQKTYDWIKKQVDNE